MTTTASEPVSLLPAVIDEGSGIPLTALSIVDGEIFIAGKPLADYDAKQIVDFRAGLLATVSRIADVKNACDRAIATKMVADGATALYHPDYDVTFLPTPGAEVIHAKLLHTELHRLAREGECDIDVVNKAVWKEPEPPIKTHKTYLNQLAKLGGKVAKVIAAGVVTGEAGPPQLSIKPKKK